MRAVYEACPQVVNTKISVILVSAAVKNDKGSADALYITDIPRPEEKPTDALVEINAFGLNCMDVIQQESGYPYSTSATSAWG